MSRYYDREREFFFWKKSNSKMGNEKSIPAGLIIEDDIKISEDWIQKSAVLSKSMTKICVFEQLLKDENVQTIETFCKNLMLYRHPFILKYVSSWKRNKTLYVATEFGKPLGLVLNDLRPMQLCIGLFNILKAIMFLQDTASASHNNISKDAIYVTTDGYWKLGRLELITTKKHTNEEDADEKGFTALACELLEKATNDDIPAVEEFIEFCKLSTKTASSHFFQQLYSHQFFSHEFVKIYSFLCDLPLKNEDDKDVFFKTLVDKLSLFPEEIIACQLGGLLLSRLVLLNTTAQEFLLPRIFTPKNEGNLCLFSIAILKKYFSPKLLNMFCIRDSQIRLIMLRHFPSCQMIFTKEQLQTKILPELLVGIKDTNEILVSATLHTLADLVPVLGASVVIGKGRTKLFADGRPLLKKDIPTNEACTNPVPLKTVEEIVSTAYSLPERPSPDGGEDVTDPVTVLEKIMDKIEVLEKLKPIDIERNGTLTSNCAVTAHTDVPVDSVIFEEKSDRQEKNTSLRIKSISNGIVKRPNREIVYPSVIPINDDLSSLDIKCSRSKNDSLFDDIDLIFKDMEPVISKTAVMNVPDSMTPITNIKFKATEIDVDGVDGWGEDVNEWINPDEEN